MFLSFNRERYCSIAKPPETYRNPPKPPETYRNPPKPTETYRNPTKPHPKSWQPSGSLVARILKWVSVGFAVEQFFILNWVSVGFAVEQFLIGFRYCAVPLQKHIKTPPKHHALPQNMGSRYSFSVKQSKVVDSKITTIHPFHRQMEHF